MVRRLARWVGPLSARGFTWGLALLFCVWIALDVVVFQFSVAMTRPAYDAMVRLRLWAAPPDPRLVIVDIDEASLAKMSPEFGRWPWPRDTLATVLEHIEWQQPAAIVWDIVFSDPDKLNPGGDAAFEAAAAQSVRSHFPVIRLPAANDGLSQLRAEHLPGLWSVQGAGRSTVALVPPALASIAQGKLGYNNATPDADGVLRRYRYSDRLPDGGVLQSMPLSVLKSLEPQAWRDQVQPGHSNEQAPPTLIAWRASAHAYPRVPFWQVFAQAEGQPQNLSFAGKVVLIGSSAPSLHDIHPTPLSPLAPGVDSLATVIDNALHRREIAELPRELQAGLAMLLCLGLAALAQRRSLATLDPLLILLPASLLLVGYVSLHGAPVFLDLRLSAGLALLLLVVLRLWNGLRRDYWCAPPATSDGPLALWAWRRAKPWQDAALDRLMDALREHAPRCRLVITDAQATWPLKLRWPELARNAAIVGPADELLAARPRLLPTLQRLATHEREPVLVAGTLPREELAAACAARWDTFRDAGPVPIGKEMLK